VSAAVQSAITSQPVYPQPLPPTEMWLAFTSQNEVASNRLPGYPEIDIPGGFNSGWVLAPKTSDSPAAMLFEMKGDS
jgi:hypothetical protein